MSVDPARELSQPVAADDVGLTGVRVRKFMTGKSDNAAEEFFRRGGTVTQVPVGKRVLSKDWQVERRKARHASAEADAERAADAIGSAPRIETPERADPPKAPAVQRRRSVSGVELERKGAALGFTLHRGTQRGAGYVVVDDKNGDRPLGNDFTASLAEVEDFLDNKATEGIDVDDINGEDKKRLTNAVGEDADHDGEESYLDDDDANENIAPSRPETKPVTKAQVAEAVRGHDNADQIKKVLGPRSTTRQDERNRTAAAGLTSPGAILAVTMAKAAGKLSEAEAKRYDENVAKAEATEQEAQARRHTLPSPWVADAEANAAAQKRPAHVKAEMAFRTNIDSLKDLDDPTYRRTQFWDGGLRRFEDEVADERARRKRFLRPTAGPYDPAPKAPEGAVAVVAAKARRLSPAETRNRLQLSRLRGEVKQAIARNDPPAAGAALNAVKDRLDHGEFLPWLDREIGISASSAERYMKAVPGKSVTAGVTP
jgi:hypothetical protein